MFLFKSIAWDSIRKSHRALIIDVLQGVRSSENKRKFVRIWRREENEIGLFKDLKLTLIAQTSMNSVLRCFDEIVKSGLYPKPILQKMLGSMIKNYLVLLDLDSSSEDAKKADAELSEVARFLEK